FFAGSSEPQLRFRPRGPVPPSASGCATYATAEEIGVVVAALQLLRRELSVWARGAACPPRRQDAALAAMWAAADRRRIGWILGYLRKSAVKNPISDGFELGG